MSESLTPESSGDSGEQGAGSPWLGLCVLKYSCILVWGLRACRGEESVLARVRGVISVSLFFKARFLLFASWLTTETEGSLFGGFFTQSEWERSRGLKKV